MKIGIVTMYFPPQVRGGAHLSAFYIAKGLALAGHEVHVFTTASPQLTEDSDWCYPGIKRHDIFDLSQKPTTSWGLDYASLRMGWDLRHYLGQNQLKLDILHAYGMDTIPAVVMCRRYGIPIATFNGYWATCPFWDHTHPVTKERNEVCDYRHLGACVRWRNGRHSPRQWAKWHFLFCSQKLRQSFAHRLHLFLPISHSVKAIITAAGFDRNKMRVCYNMIELSDYSNLDANYLYSRYQIPAGRRLFLFAGRFAPYKGTADIIEAMPIILGQHPETHFVFIGQGSMLSTLEAKVAELGLNERATFGGFVNPKEMPDAYASAYAYLHTATWPEPFARGPIEALAAGTAVIATTTGGTSEVIINEQTGLLVPPFNPLALAQACIRLLDQPALRMKLAQTGQTEVHQKFTLTGQINQYLAAYESIL